MDLNLNIPKKILWGGMHERRVPTRGNKKRDTRSVSRRLHQATTMLQILQRVQIECMLILFV